MTSLNIFFLFFCLIKWFFHEYLSFIDIWFDIVLSTFGLSSFYRYYTVRRLIYVSYLYEAIQTSNTDLISRIYQIIIVNILKIRIIDILVTILSNL